jgi:CubicO group peptidase (beta-lactamase class C family)
MKRLAVVVLILWSLAPPGQQATDRSTPDWGAVDGVFERFDRSDTPGCALGVVQDGELVYARGYGLANLELGVAITPQSVFRQQAVHRRRGRHRGARGSPVAR